MNLSSSLENLVVGQRLGSGSFASCYVGKLNGEKYALKFLNNPVDGKALKKELAALQVLSDSGQDPTCEPNDRNVIRFYKYVEEFVIDGVPKRLIIMELAPYGQIFDFIAMTRPFDETLTRTLFRQLINGLHFLHSHNVYHRDIKPENILIGKDYQLKLADFGLAGIFANMAGPPLMSTRLGTPQYIAPEIGSYAQYDPAAVDMWGAGIMLFVMLVASPPFSAPNQTDWWFHKLMRRNYSLFWSPFLPKRPNLSEEVKDLVNRLLDVNPVTRLKLPGVKAHPWFCRPVLSDADFMTEMSERYTQVISDASATQVSPAAAAASANDSMDSSNSAVGSFVSKKANADAMSIYAEEPASADAEKQPCPGNESIDPIPVSFAPKDAFVENWQEGDDREAPAFVRGDTCITGTSFGLSCRAGRAFRCLVDMLKRTECNFEASPENFQVQITAQVGEYTFSAFVQLYSFNNPPRGGAPNGDATVVVFRRQTGQCRPYYSFFVAVRRQFGVELPSIVVTKCNEAEKRLSHAGSASSVASLPPLHGSFQSESSFVSASSHQELASANSASAGGSAASSPASPPSPPAGVMATLSVESEGGYSSPDSRF